MPHLAKPVANPVVVLREEFDDWAVLFNPDTADAVGINPVGVTVWKLADGQHTLQDILQAVRQVYDDVPDAAESQVSSFLEDLHRRGFIGYEVEATG